MSTSTTPISQTPPRATIFVHIPKTAGMSLTKTVVEQYKGRVHERMGGNHDLVALLERPAHDRARIGLITGHLSLENPLSDCDVPSPEILTMIREPISRVISLYTYMRRMPGHHLYPLIKEHNLSLADMFTDRFTDKTIEYDNFQTRMLAGLECTHKHFGAITEADLQQALSRVETMGVVVGIQEYFEASIALYSHQLGWDESKITIHQTNTGEELAKKAKRKDSDEYQPTDADLDAIRTHNALDIQLYETLKDHAISEFTRLNLKGDFPRATARPSFIP